MQYIGAMASHIKIRDARPTDAFVLHALLGEFAAHESSAHLMVSTPEQLRHALARTPPHFQALLAEDAGTAVGFATWTLDFMPWGGRPVLRLDDIYVRPSVRGAGLEERMMRAIAERARAAGTAVRWEMRSNNTAARAFYDRLGARAQEKTMWNWLPEALERFLKA